MLEVTLALLAGVKLASLVEVDSASLVGEILTLLVAGDLDYLKVRW